jgi:hypothetical protein
MYLLIYLLIIMTDIELESINNGGQRKEEKRKKLAWAKNLKDKDNPNDDKKTPRILAKKLIDMTPLLEGDTVLDGFAGDGAFYDQYPSYVKKRWSEIKKKRDFFKRTRKVDWVGPTNPPYSKINDVFEQSIKIANKGIAFLIGIMNVTPKRIAMLEKGGFGITHMHIAQVTGWFGKSLYIVAQKNKPSIISYDVKSYRMPIDEDKAYKEKMKKYQEKYYVSNFQGKMKEFRKNNKS